LTSTFLENVENKSERPVSKGLSAFLLKIIVDYNFLVCILVFLLIKRREDKQHGKTDSLDICAGGEIPHAVGCQWDARLLGHALCDGRAADLLKTDHD
jgi:hypothetical protein